MTSKITSLAEKALKRLFCKGCLRIYRVQSETQITVNIFSNNPKLYNPMKEQFDNKVVNDVPTKKKYVKPAIEVIPIEMQAPLLAASMNGTAGWSNGGTLSTDDWNE